MRARLGRRRCYQPLGGGSTPAGRLRDGVKLGRLSRELYLRLGKELGLDSGFTETGYYFVAETEEEMEGFVGLVVVGRQAGVENEWIEPDEGKRRFPDLNWDRFVGATFTPDDGYVHPPIAARNATYAAVRSEAVDLFEMCEVRDIEHIGEGFSVRTTRGTFEAEKVVNAGGPRGARNVGAMVGLDVPVMAVRHQVVTFPTLADRSSHPFPLFFAVGKGYYVRPEEEGAALGLSNPVDEADTSGRYQIDFDWDYYEEMRPDWESAFPALKDLPVSRVWAASTGEITTFESSPFSSSMSMRPTATPPTSCPPVSAGPRTSTSKGSPSYEMVCGTNP